jgi:predicted LPLAT superfamily acyltransferase
MIGAHIGCWEAGADFFGKYSDRFNIVLYDDEYTKIKEALNQNSIRRRPKIISVNDDGLENVLKIKQALDAGEFVCFQGDRYVSGASSLEAEFLGQTARFPAGPFIMGARTGVPVLFYYAMRERGRRYKFYFVRAQSTATPSRRPERQLLEEWAAATEDMVRRYPEQWFNFYKFWN